MLKHPLLKFILLCVLVLCVASANAEYIDLSKGGMQITPWVRCDEGKIPQACAVVELNGTNYVVVHDSKGETKIFKVINDKPVLIWARDTI